MTKPENPPAFPQRPSQMVNGEFGQLERSWGYEGMSLRDWFAGQIMGGFCASIRQSADAETAGLMARDAYRLAAAMLAERDKHQP